MKRNVSFEKLVLRVCMVGVLWFVGEGAMGLYGRVMWFVVEDVMSLYGRVIGLVGKMCHGFLGRGTVDL